jgi:hypothetical protein
MLYVLGRSYACRTVRCSCAGGGVMTDSLSSTFTGQVRSANEKGIKLEGHDEWLNFSKFAVGIVAPERGQTVMVVTDKAGFVRAVQPVDGAAPIAGASDQPRAAQAPSAPSQRDVTITRLAVLKAAAEFGAARPSLKSGEVLLIAESWERWVLRDDTAGVDDALVDAF